PTRSTNRIGSLSIKQYPCEPPCPLPPAGWRPDSFAELLGVEAEAAQLEEVVQLVFQRVAQPAQPQLHDAQPPPVVRAQFGPPAFLNTSASPSQRRPGRGASSRAERSLPSGRRTLVCPCRRNTWCQPCLWHPSTAPRRREGPSGVRRGSPDSRGSLVLFTDG